MHIAYLYYLVEGDPGTHHVRQFAEAARVMGNRVDVQAMNLAPGGGGSARASGGLYSRLRSTLKRLAGRYLHEPKEILWNPLYVRRELVLLRAARPDVLLVRDHLLTASCVPVAR